MAWRTIAKKDFREAMDSRVVSYLLGLTVFAFIIGGYILPMEADAPTTSDYPGYMSAAVGLLVPLLGILLGYASIVSERESGRINLLLSLPNSRRDVVVGKLLGRAAVLGLALGIGLAVGGALVVYPFGSLELAAFVAYAAVTFAYGLSFVGIAMALSTLTTSKQIATAGAFGVYFLFAIVWEDLGSVLELGLDQVGLADGGLPNWALFLHGAEPGMAYGRVVDGFFDDVVGGEYLGPDAPWYLGEWAALGVLAFWVVVPLALGYWRFEVTDL